MLGSTVDHLLAVVLIGAVFIAAVSVMPNIGYINFLSVDQQQMRNVAESALNTILLDSGYPTTWGRGVTFDPSSVTRFGLDSSSASGMYILDPDKVMRIVEKDEYGRPNPIGYLSAEKARQLLGLQQYGFNLTISAPFQATIRDLYPIKDPSNPTLLELQTINFEVTVKLDSGKPIPNALVSATVIYSLDVGGQPVEKYIIGCVRDVKKTNEIGKCTFAKSLSGQVSDSVIVLQVTVSDMSTVTTTYRRGTWVNNYAYINMIGSNVILTTPPLGSNDNRWILSISAFTRKDQLINLFNGTQYDVLNWGSNIQWVKNIPSLDYIEPSIIIFSFRAVEKNAGRQGVLVVGPYPNIFGNQVMSYSCGNPPTNTVTIQRSVSIRGMTYIVKFVLWKR